MSEIRILRHGNEYIASTIVPICPECSSDLILDIKKDEKWYVWTYWCKRCGCVWEEPSK